MSLRKIVLCVAVAVAWACVAAWARPSGWVFMAWPSMYLKDRLGWEYVDPGGAQWCYNAAEGGWKRFGTQVLRSGWVWFQWPYAYSAANGRWYYFGGAGTLWCYSYGNPGWTSQYWHPLSAVTENDIHVSVNSVLQVQGMNAAAGYVQNNIPEGFVFYSGTNGFRTVTDVDLGDIIHGTWLVGDGMGPPTYSTFLFYSNSIPVLRLYLGL